MAKATFSPAIDGVSGKSGNLVFRRVRGGTVVAQRPKPSRRKPSAAQLAQRERFARATEYARQVLSDPWQRRAYEALAKTLGRRADKLVTSDFLTPPVVEEIDVSEYRGRPRGVVRVFATDDVEVIAVEIRITTKVGTIVEQGPAIKIHGVWCYTATASAPANTSLLVTATARDRPGNLATGSQAISG